MELLLKYASSSQVDNNDMTILHWAVIYNNLEAVNLILKCFRKKLKTKLFLNFINQKNKEGLVALHDAVDKDEMGKYTKTHHDILNALLNHLGLHITERDNNGMTVLHWAVANNNLEAVKAILEHSKSTLTHKAYTEFIQTPTYINPQTGEGDCPAIYFTTDQNFTTDQTAPLEDEQDARATSLAIFNLLLPACEINYQDGQGYTIAHWAVVQGRNDLLKVLIKHKANLKLQDKKGHTVVHATIETMADALKNNKWKLMQDLIWEEDSMFNQLLNLDLPRIDFTIKDINGKTPLALALEYKLFFVGTIEKLNKKTQGQGQRSRNEREKDKKKKRNADPLSDQKPSIQIKKRK